MPRKAGFAHRTQYSEIWTASVTDLNTVGGINHSYWYWKQELTITLTVAHPQQVVFPSSIKRILGQKGECSQMTCTWADFAEKLSLIYRFPGGNIFLNKWEYFVTLVERQTVEYVSKQDERSRSRADAYVKGNQGKKSSSWRVSRWSRQMSLILKWFKNFDPILKTNNYEVTHLLLQNRCSDRWETSSHHSTTFAQPTRKK